MIDLIQGGFQSIWVEVVRRLELRHQVLLTTLCCVSGRATNNQSSILASGGGGGNDFEYQVSLLLPGRFQNMQSKNE